MRRFYTLIICLFCLGSISAQQIPINNQYLLNKYSLSPAYAGINNNFEGFFTYRNSWVGIDGAPKTNLVNINGLVGKNTGLGLSITSDNIGIFQNFSAQLSYAYHLKISNSQLLSFGISGGILKNQINLSNSNSNFGGQIDNVIANRQTIEGNTFDVCVGVLYKFKGLNVGIVVPELIENRIRNNSDNNNTLYRVKRHYVGHISYLYDINKNLQIEPYIISRTVINSPMQIEVATLLKYKKQIWAGATFRKGSCFGLSFGGTLKEKFVMNYTYEFFGTGMLGNSSGTHEISIGYLFIKHKSNSKSKQPYYKWTN